MISTSFRKIHMTQDFSSIDSNLNFQKKRYLSYISYIYLYQFSKFKIKVNTYSYKCLNFRECLTISIILPLLEEEFLSTPRSQTFYGIVPSSLSIGFLSNRFQSMRFQSIRVQTMFSTNSPFQSSI